MPFDQWYDDATREAATARVLQRRMTNPTDRNVLTVVAEEFSVPRQTLSDWVDEASPESARPQRKPRPKFSQVVRSTKETRVEPPTDDAVDETPTPVEVEVEQAEPTAFAGSDELAAQDEPAESAAPAEPEPEREPVPVLESEPEPEPAPVPAPTTVEPAADGPDATPAPAAEPVAAPAPAPAPPAVTSADRRVSALEAEVAALRAGNRSLVEALRVLVDD